MPIAPRRKPTSNVSINLKTFENDFLKGKQESWIHFLCHFANIETVMSDPMAISDCGQDTDCGDEGEFSTSVTTHSKPQELSRPVQSQRVTTVATIPKTTMMTKKHNAVENVWKSDMRAHVLDLLALRHTARLAWSCYCNESQRLLINSWLKPPVSRVNTLSTPAPPPASNSTCRWFKHRGSPVFRGWEMHRCQRVIHRPPVNGTWAKQQWHRRCLLEETSYCICKYSAKIDLA